MPVTSQVNSIFPEGMMVENCKSLPSASVVPKYFCAVFSVRTTEAGFFNAVASLPFSNGKVNMLKKLESAASIPD
jgi:hypothetical protein